MSHNPLEHGARNTEHGAGTLQNQQAGSVLRDQGCTSEPVLAHDARITVLMPLKHYHPDYLEQSVRSVVQQTCGDWRLVIIAEPEDLGHFEQLLSAACADSRTCLIGNAGRKLAGAINSGMRYAQTEFVALLLADDLWAPDAVRVLNGYIGTHPDVDFFHTSRMVIDEHGRPISSVHASRATFTLEDFKRSSPVKHLLCWRRSKGLSAGGLDESLNSVGPDDYDFPWTMAEHGARFKAVHECLYYYRDHRECYRLTTHLPLSVHRRECRRIRRKHGVAWWERRRFVARAQRSYLRQCLYRNAIDQWIKEWFAYDARRGWRETYR
jgi:glycosyltransferase involved in cell wall biosynthesis